MKKAPKARLKVGDVMTVPVGKEHICDSDPCNKDSCMVSRAETAYLIATYGGTARDYKVKSTNHGTTFELKGRKYLAVFDSKTAATIYRYDQTFRLTRSKDRARAGVQPFTTRLIIESSVAVVRGPPMSAETKATLKFHRSYDVPAPYLPKTTGSRRELSL